MASSPPNPRHARHWTRPAAAPSPTPAVWRSVTPTPVAQICFPPRLAHSCCPPPGRSQRPPALRPHAHPQRSERFQRLADSWKGPRSRPHNRRARFLSPPRGSSGLPACLCSLPAPAQRHSAPLRRRVRRPSPLRLRAAPPPPHRHARLQPTGVRKEERGLARALRLRYRRGALRLRYRRGARPLRYRRGARRLRCQRGARRPSRRHPAWRRAVRYRGGQQNRPAGGPRRRCGAREGSVRKVPGGSPILSKRHCRRIGVGMAHGREHMWLVADIASRQPPHAPPRVPRQGSQTPQPR